MCIPCYRCSTCVYLVTDGVCVYLVTDAVCVYTWLLRQCVCIHGYRRSVCIPGYRCSIGARWGRRSSPPGCWLQPQVVLRPAGKAPEPVLTMKSMMTARKRRTMKMTDDWKT